MAALGERGTVQSDGAFPVAKPDRSSLTGLMEHDKPFLAKDRQFIKRYLIRQPLGYALLLGSSRYYNATDGQESHLLCVEKDLDSMRAVLSSGGWEVDTPYGDSTEKENYAEVMQVLREKDLKSHSCFMLYYSGHGSPEGMLLQPNYDLISFKEVVNMVLGMDDLLGKPKILIFDCCRENPLCQAESQGCLNSGFKSLGENFAATHHDMIVCFACSNNTASLGALSDGSIFTQHFVVAMREFGKELSFVELLDQAKGNTLHVARSVFKMNQQPVSYSGLNAQLLLKETEMAGDKVKLVKSPVVLVPLGPQAETKGRYPFPSQPAPSKSHPHHLPRHTPATPPSDSEAPVPMDTSRHSEPVMKDHVTTTTVTRFTTKHDIVTNVGSLGNGHHVFICYLPDPASPYDLPDPARVQQNLDRISLLHYDLQFHGFTVMSDLGLGDQTPLSLLQWYVERIERCNHVILVCSPAFKELFTSTRPQREVKDQKARRFLHYSSTIYTECESSVARQGGGGGMSKFIPVILDPEWADIEQSVPLLFRGSHIYELFETCQRKFDYNNKERYFERLVCRMVGINRATIDGPRQGAPIIIGNVSEDVNRRKFLAQARMPRPGYVTVQSSVGRLASDQSSREQAWARVTPTGPQDSPIGPVYTAQPMYPYPVETHQTPHPAQTAVEANRRMLLAHAAQRQQGYQTVDFHMNPAPGPTASLPTAGDYPPHPPLTQPLQSQFVPAPYTAHPPPPHAHPLQPTPAATVVTSDPMNPDPSSLPLTAPPPELFLWLSDELVHWKFLARYLRLEESLIDRIALENQNNIREQCYKMLLEFKQKEGAGCTCQRLGRALLQSEKNRHLFAQYCAKLRSLSVAE